MKTRFSLLAAATSALIGSGCVSNLAESPYRPDAVRPSDRTVANQPYRIDEVYVATAADATRMYEAIEKQNASSINAKLNGWINGTDYAANARAAKEQIQDAMETQKVFASNAFGVDEKNVTPPMVAFWASIARVKSESELAEMGLPDYRPTEDENEPTDQELQSAAYAPAMLGQIVGEDVLDADSLTDSLSEQYPGLFAGNGKPVRVAIGVMMGPTSWRSRYGAGSENHLDFGIWVWSATAIAGKNDPFPAPTAAFSAVHHQAMSVLGPATVKQSSKDNEFVKGSADETKAFIRERICAAIVEAINNLPDNRFGEIGK